MRKYTIGYIDESEDDIDYFKRFADEDFDIIDFMPVPNPDELVTNILSTHIDVLIVDYDLKEENPTIGYYGEEIIEKVLAIKEGFPVFIFTSHDEDGDVTEQSHDVDIVIDKADMANKNEKKLLRRIKQKIDNYYKRIKVTEDRLLELLQKKDKSELTFEEEDELIECDDFLERTLNKTHSIKHHIKEVYRKDVKGMIELMNQIDETIKKINPSNDEI
jgi:hypothetical protein